MRTRSRLLLALAALTLGLAYVLPLWRVTLEAPQYPGGIGMQIWIDTITGLNPHDLQNINGLNHYIGMQTIEPDAIPELDWMPWLFAGLIALGLGAAALGRRWSLYAWTGLFALLLAVGFVDYYQWGYDYGHNLSPDAAIKIPGMAYQPPVIGSKQMLNFVAHSWPDTGGVAVFAALLMGLGAIVLERRGHGWPAALAPRSPVATAVAGLLALVLVMGCEPEPRPLRVGEMACAHCRMTVSDARFGAEFVASTGKVYPFDAIECLRDYLDEHAKTADAAHSLWVASFDAPGLLIRVDRAYFLHSAALQSPMGGGLAAFRDVDARNATLAEVGGEGLDWNGVLALGKRDGQAAHTH